MILCNHECDPICDFCIYQMSCGKGAGVGFCMTKQEFVDWCSSCNDDFHCFSALLEPEVPNLLLFFTLTYKIFTLEGPEHDKNLTFKERFNAWRNLADYKFEGKRRGKAA